MIQDIVGFGVVIILAWLAMELRSLRAVIETATAELYDMVEQELGELKTVERPPVQVKVVMPGDIEKLKQDSHTIMVGHKQPGGAYQWIGSLKVPDITDRGTWPTRIADELATPGRAIKLPNGTIEEGVQ